MAWTVCPRSSRPSGYRASTSELARGNFDYTISPTLLFHFGAGFQSHRNPDTVPPVSGEYDNTQLGIVGSPGNGFPRFGALGDNVYGGIAVGFGPGSRNLFIGRRLSGTPSLSWVHGNHTYKFGAEWKYDTTNSSSKTNLSPAYGFSGAETSQPLYGQVLPTWNRHRQHLGQFPARPIRQRYCRQRTGAVLSPDFVGFVCAG